MVGIGVIKRPRLNGTPGTEAESSGVLLLSFDCLPNVHHLLSNVIRPYYKYNKNPILNLWTLEDFMKHDHLHKEAAKPRAATTLFPERSVVSPAFNVLPLTIYRQPSDQVHRWWIVPDTKVLLDDQFFIDKLVKSDPTCRLLLPYIVLHDLTTMTQKRLPAFVRMPARRVVEYMRVESDTRDRLRPSIVMQGPLEAERAVDNHHAKCDAVINACMQMKELYNYVVLITDDTVRINRAAQVNLPAFTLEQARSVVKFSYLNHRECPITVTRSFPSAEAAVNPGT